VTGIFRWLFLAGAALLIIGLIAYARGPEHHHGQYVGSHGGKVLIVTRR
jgi:hypothetical protein